MRLWRGGASAGRGSRAEPSGPAEPATLRLAGREVPLEVRRSARARRLTLTADASRGVIRLTLPPRASARTAERFLTSRMDWLAERARRFPQPCPLIDGARIPYRGKTLLCRWRADAARAPRLAGETLTVGGPAEFMNDRIVRWLKREARAALIGDCEEIGARGGIETDSLRVTVRDTRRQWGSCAPDGRLSFSWRLILAPDFVRRSVAAHELAHLRHRHHGPTFHAEAERLLGASHAPADAWLRANGALLHWIGRQ